MYKEIDLLLKKSISEPTEMKLGQPIQRTDIKSSIGPFNTLPEYQAHYPQSVTTALSSLYAEYNAAFKSLVANNREWETDYQVCTDSNGTPINGWIQIDMVGLPDTFLSQAHALSPTQVKESLRHKIFEIENSLAMYQLLERLFPKPDGSTKFNEQFRTSLDVIRQKHGRPIALLAVTDQKYEAMRASEFGKGPGEPLTSTDVKALSGFDALLGPTEFRQHLEENSGHSAYLLYARTSDPLTKLKDPHTLISNPLLADNEIRREIRANVLTFNVDAPDVPATARINDTKRYLPPMGMAHPVSEDQDLFSPEFSSHLKQGKPYIQYEQPRLSTALAEYLDQQNIDPDFVERGEISLRAKPMQGTYGCYGHLTGKLPEKRFRQELRHETKNRGTYITQPEMETPQLIDTITGQTYNFIDRVFFTTDGESYHFMGGFRSCMPQNSVEAVSGRNHGSKFTVWAEIT